MKQLFASVFSRVKTRLHIFISIMFLDCIMLFVYGFFSANISSRIAGYGNSILQASASMPKEVYSSLLHLDFFSFLLSNPEIRPLFFKILLTLAIFYAIIFVLYGVIEGYAWRLSHSLLGVKIKKHFIKDFMQINLAWLMVYIMYRLSHYLHNLIDSIRKTDTVPIVSTALLLLLVYLVLISGSIIARNRSWRNIRKTFSIAILRVRTLIPLLIVVTVGFVIIHYLLKFAAQVNTYMMVISGILLVFPALACARLLFITYIERLS